MEKMYRVMLANSSEDYSISLTATLKQSDRYAVVGYANDGVRASDMLHEVDPEILVVDMMLPQADGISVIKTANAMEKPPMLLVLADFMTEFVSSLLVSLGVQYVLLKPCPTRAVLERLDEMRNAMQRRPYGRSRDIDVEALVRARVRAIGGPARRASHPSRHRGCVGLRRSGDPAALLRLYRFEHEGQADQFGIHCTHRR